MASSAAAGACALRQQRPDSYERRVLELRGMLAASGRAPYPAAAQSVAAPRSATPPPPPAGGAAEEVLKEDAARLRSLSTASQDCDAAEEGETAEGLDAATEVDRIARARARNREHARNTRARKKARIADMQRRVDVLNDEASRLRLQLEATSTASLLCELHVPKFKAPDGGAALEDEKAVAGLPAAAHVDSASAAACGALPEAMPAPSALDAIDAMGSPEETRRERARLHAKHTRDRKKVFVRTIEQTISELESSNARMREQLQARNRPAGGEEIASLSAASAAAAAAAGWRPPLPRPAMGMPLAAAPGLALSAPGSVHAHPSMVMHAAAMPDPSQAALGLPAAVMSSMAHAHPAVAPRAPDAHERAIIERILAEKAVQLEATHDHLVANLAMYQPPQPPPPHSSQYFCQR